MAEATLTTLGQQINNLGVSVGHQFDAIEQKIGNLTVSVGQQINAVEQKISNLTVSVEKQINKLAVSVKEGFDSVDERLLNLEKGQEDILLRLDEHAYKFEVKDLRHKVEKLEKKIQ